jgi:hypothetical protein
MAALCDGEATGRLGAWREVAWRLKSELSALSVALGEFRGPPRKLCSLRQKSHVTRNGCPWPSTTITV